MPAFSGSGNNHSVAAGCIFTEWEERRTLVAEGSEIRSKQRSRRKACTVETSPLPEGLLPAAEVACF